MDSPEVVGTEGWREALPDEAPPVICLGGEQIGFLLLVSELHGRKTLHRLQLSHASMPQDSPCQPRIISQHAGSVMSTYHIELVIEDARTFLQLSRAPDNAVHQQWIRYNDHLHDRCALDTCAFAHL